MTRLLTENEQFQALNVLDYLSDLFTSARKETFTRDEILIIIDIIRSDGDFFDPQVVIARQIANSEIDNEPLPDV